MKKKCRYNKTMMVPNAKVIHLVNFKVDYKVIEQIKQFKYLFRKYAN